jgi:hypothetical protein
VLNTQTKNYLNAWDGALLERHMLGQMFKNLRGVYGSRKFITFFSKQSQDGAAALQFHPDSAWKRSSNLHET